jgi:hypothetical protein
MLKMGEGFHILDGNGVSSEYDDWPKEVMV